MKVPSLSPRRCYNWPMSTVARPDDWNRSPLPAEQRLVPWGRKFSENEMASIRMGFKPLEMEDKWFIYFENGILHCHRSWTGMCIFEVRFEKQGDGWSATEFRVNNDQEQYRGGDDSFETELLSALIDMLLLHRASPIPHPHSDAGENLLWAWHIFGRGL